MSLISGTGRLTRFSLLCCAAAALWLAFSTLVVPPLIQSAYNGESLSWLNSLISGQAELPVDFYLGRWHQITVQVLVAIVAFWLLTIVATSEFFARRCVGQATPGALGAIRMWTCAILLVSTAWDDLPSIARLPIEYHLDMGFMRLAHDLPIGFDRFVTSEASLRLWQRATEVLLFLGMIGWRTRVVIPACTVFALVMNGILREYTGFWHQNLVPIYVLIVLSLTPSGDGWSVDRLRRIYRGEAVPDSDTPSFVYGWARYACWVPIALTYASAGFSKLRAAGLDWMSPTGMRALLYEQTLYPRAGNYSISLHLAPAPDLVFVFLAAAAVTGEALFITVLFSRIARRVFPAVSMLMHIGIVFLQNIVFLDLIFLLFVFYDFTGIRKRIASSGRAGRAQVFYDGDCRFCRRTVRVLRSLDIFRRLEFENFRLLDVAELNRRYSVSLESTALENEMRVRVGQNIYGGFDAYRALAWKLPALWVLAPWLYVPGIAWIGRRVYAAMAARRLGIAACDATCAADTTALDTPVMVPPRPSRSFAFACAAGLAAFVSAQGYIWANRIEFYPFTAVQMFTDKPRTVVIYFKTLGHWESGVVAPIPLESTLPVMSINSRYEQLFTYCFGLGEESAVLCKKGLAVLGSAYNDKAPVGRRLTQLEIQKWKWDFAAAPNDPNYGELDARVIGDVPIAGPYQGAQSDIRANHR